MRYFQVAVAHGLYIVVERPVGADIDGLRVGLEQDATSFPQAMVFSHRVGEMSRVAGQIIGEAIGAWWRGFEGGDSIEMRRGRP